MATSSALAGRLLGQARAPQMTTALRLALFFLTAVETEGFAVFTAPALFFTTPFLEGDFLADISMP